MPSEFVLNCWWLHVVGVVEEVLILVHAPRVHAVNATQNTTNRFMDRFMTSFMFRVGFIA